MTDDDRIKMEAAAFRGLVEHLQRRTDVQNIDLMNLAGFCRNCLSKWYMNAGKDLGLELDYADAQKEIYGMDIAEWKQKFQNKATAEQLETFEATRDLHAHVSGHASKEKQETG